MQTTALFLVAVALIAGANACSDDTTPMERCPEEFERKANLLVPDIEAGRKSPTAICPLAVEMEECMMRVVNNLCDEMTKMFMQPMVRNLMQAARDEAGCTFVARRDTQKLVARSLALSKQKVVTV
ncbi:uncharacterized protein LOC101846260 [Aplysia californica]|uniref:Uncharacterized protein LOC101846260 n=1 Tax=Aplysia californica TaxID=6500 RepID=A0ABM0JC96_APLCA|nr:uncharacterized protein LOC101846260 [Aplysia californica]